VAHGKNRTKGSILTEECGTEFVAGDIRDAALFSDIADDFDYIFHCAAITKSADMVAKPVDIIATNVDGTRNMLELARTRHCKSFVYLSSMEVYGRTELCAVGENDLGYLDLSNPRSSYPESKRLCEMMCMAYAAQYEIPAKVARLALIFGAGVPNDNCDTRVANQFARSALAEKDIELHTKGNSIANCCSTSDAIRGLLTILFKGNNGEAYNIANIQASMSIRETAELVADKVCDGQIKVIVNVPDDIATRGYAPDVGHTLNADKLKALGWSPKYGLSEMFTLMLADWREQMNQLRRADCGNC
jgi:nucleoside-diphosphate-sugar epimerase